MDEQRWRNYGGNNAANGVEWLLVTAASFSPKEPRSNNE